MQRVAIITAIYDEYDTLKPALAQEGVEVDWVCVTDKPIADPGDWRVVVEPRPGQHPNVAAKRPKMLPWEYTDECLCVWVDASFRITSPSFAGDMLSILSTCDIAQFRHPWRDCIYDEAEASLGLEKYAHQRTTIEAQMQRYREFHPEHWGLWATGVIGRNFTAPDTNAALGRHGERWLRDCQEWSYQDQLSEAVHLRFLALRPVALPGDHIRNPWLSFEGSSRH